MQFRLENQRELFINVTLCMKRNKYIFANKYTINKPLYKYNKKNLTTKIYLRTTKSNKLFITPNNMVLIQGFSLLCTVK